MSKYLFVQLTILATNQGLEIVGVVLVITGIIIRYMIGRNRFNRRSITGVETFSSYERMNLTRLLEWLGSIIGLLLIIGGIIMVVLALLNHHPHPHK